MILQRTEIYQKLSALNSTMSDNSINGLASVYVHRDFQLNYDRPYCYRRLCQEQSSPAVLNVPDERVHLAIFSNV